METYRIPQVPRLPDWEEPWDGPNWSRAEAGRVAHFHPKSSDHHPGTRFRLLLAGRTLALFFRVRDAYVRIRESGHQAMVCRDSCVEFFVQPRPDAGYFNFEFSAGGTLHASFISDWTRVPGGFAGRRLLTPEECGCVERRADLPPLLEEEILEPTEWTLRARLPLDLLEAGFGPLDIGPEAQWRGNFFKCADLSSHPHWGAWSPIGSELNFHQPDRFGRLEFETDVP